MKIERTFVEKMIHSHLIQSLLDSLDEYRKLGIAEQIDYFKFSLYSIITHSTAIEGSTVTQLENQLLFDDGLTAQGRSLYEQMMNLDLKLAYDYCLQIKDQNVELSVNLLKSIAALVMKNTGSTYKTIQGNFSAANGDLRLVNVTAGNTGRSYLPYQKISAKLIDFCSRYNNLRQTSRDVIEIYAMSFNAHLELVTIHPWADGNGRMARLVMNFLQFERDLVPVKITKEQKREYIQALIDSRAKQNSEIFCEAMFNLHLKDIRQEIKNYQQDQILELPTISM